MRNIDGFPWNSRGLGDGCLSMFRGIYCGLLKNVANGLPVAVKTSAFAKAMVVRRGGCGSWSSGSFVGRNGYH